MPKVCLSRRASFSSSHRLHSHQLSNEENRRLFGKCNSANGHGHNYVIEVIVRGEIDEKTGIVMNLDLLKEAIHSCILSRLDHKNLNLDVKEFKTLNPTAENIVVVCWQWLLEKIPSSLLYEVRLHETENNLVIYRGD